jgi:hypothetical protein
MGQPVLLSAGANIEIRCDWKHIWKTWKKKKMFTGPLASGRGNFAAYKIHTKPSPIPHDRPPSKVFLANFLPLKWLIWQFIRWLVESTLDSLHDFGRLVVVYIFTNRPSLIFVFSVEIFYFSLLVVQLLCLHVEFFATHSVTSKYILHRKDTIAKVAFVPNVWWYFKISVLQALNCRKVIFSSFWNTEKFSYRIFTRLWTPKGKLCRFREWNCFRKFSLATSGHRQPEFFDNYLLKKTSFETT